jgi:hypothetical protein
MAQRDPERYTQGDDGLIVEKVGRWAVAKLKILTDYVYAADLQRNADRYTDEAYDQFDKFAPGWRGKVSTDMNQNALRAALIRYWCDKILRLNFPQAPHWELITGDRGQRLYWLVLLARDQLAHKLWSKITSAAKAPRFL